VQFGRALYQVAMRSDEYVTAKTKQSKSFSGDSAPLPTHPAPATLQMLMSVPRPSLREIGQPRASFYIASSSSTRRHDRHQYEEWIDASHGDMHQSGDMDSESFVGRSMLRKMGWVDGVQLGRLGGTASAPIDVKLKKNRLGVGAREEH
jgi:hypothetical protein